MTRIMLVGNPNCGKTTLFNALTGEHQRIGNWPGVTVEKITGTFHYQQQTFVVIDLPGVYSLASSGENSPDEQITATAVLQEEVDIIINVVDASHLERHLYLTSQLLELGKAMIMVINMTDVAKRRGITIDVTALSQALNCPVLSLQAHRGLGVDDLCQAMQVLSLKAPACVEPLALLLPDWLETLMMDLEPSLRSVLSSSAKSRYVLYRLLEGDTRLLHVYHDLTAVRQQLTLLQPMLPLEVDIVMADARFNAIHDVCAKTMHKSGQFREHLTEKIDRLVLHRVAAIPIFLAVIYVLFWFSMGVGGVLQDFFSLSTELLLVTLPGKLMCNAHLQHTIFYLSLQGIGQGISTTLTFIPVLATMYFFLALLESSGYMARAAFIVDKLMRLMGLPGKAFVPMIVGFGCNVPAIMSTRTLENTQDRLLTILMSPFMSCSARLAIYAVFVAAFFPTKGPIIVFSLYLVGILMAIVTGYVLRRTLFQGRVTPLIIELPSYHCPSLRRLLRETNVRLRSFIVRAGKFIIPISMVLSILNALPVTLSVPTGCVAQVSLLAWVGQHLTGIFSPMGIHADNWPATVGLLTGIFAKEVVIGSLNALYSEMLNMQVSAGSSFTGWSAWQEALYVIGQHFMLLKQSILQPAIVHEATQQLSSPIFGVMWQKFDGAIGAYAYLLFILLYIPCVSTMAVIRQETDAVWMWFSIVWSLLVAYTVAVTFYQLATFRLHPMHSMLWILLLFGAMAGYILIMQCFPRCREVRNVVEAA